MEKKMKCYLMHFVKIKYGNKLKWRICCAGKTNILRYRLFSCFIMIDRTDILQELYEDITIPEYVYEEFQKAPQYIIEHIKYMIELNFLKVQDIKTD